MTITLHLDTEQAALIDAALEFSVAALSVRAQRVDPLRVVSDSAQLQKLKLDQVREQMTLPPQPTWSSMSNSERERLIALSRLLIEGRLNVEKDAALAQIIDHCDTCRISQGPKGARAKRPAERLPHEKVARSKSRV